MNVKTATTELGAKNEYPAGKIYKQFNGQYYWHEFIESPSM